jgi:hypothetical protein
MQFVRPFSEAGWEVKFGSYVGSSAGLMVITGPDPTPAEIERAAFVADGLRNAKLGPVKMGKAAGLGLTLFVGEKPPLR